MQREQRAPQVRLTWQDPVTNEESTILAPLPITIGRARENTVFLNSDAVSRQHAIVEYANGEVVLRDWLSKNGLLLNQQRVKRAEVHNGDTIQIGPFRFFIDTNPIAPSQAPTQAPVGIPVEDYGTMGGPQDYGTMAAPQDFGTIAAPQDFGTVAAPQGFDIPVRPPETYVQPAPAPAQQIRVRWIDPTTNQPREVTTVSPISIGRHRENTISLPVINASRQHATLTLEGGQIKLTDQGSGNEIGRASCRERV